MEYFNHKLARKHPVPEGKSETPVLTQEDEEFLQRIASEGTPPPLPARPQNLAVAGESQGNDAQLALIDDARSVPLPEVPDTPDEVTPVTEAKGKGKAKSGKTAHTWSFLRRDSRDNERKAQQATALDLHSVAVGLKSEDAHVNEDGIVTPHEGMRNLKRMLPHKFSAEIYIAAKEEEDMTNILEQLNLAAVNNRVFSISTESQELLRKFTLVLKDLVNGVPTAYDDLESLLTNSENQLQRSYASLPSFLQKLIEQLPSKMTQTLGPEMLAVAAERHGVSSKYTEPAAGLASKMGLKMKVPSLKDLVTKPGAVAGMLRAIMNFLKMRFPAFMGMNVLWSLALFGKRHSATSRTTATKGSR